MATKNVTLLILCCGGVMWKRNVFLLIIGTFNTLLDIATLDIENYINEKYFPTH